MSRVPYVQLDTGYSAFFINGSCFAVTSCNSSPIKAQLSNGVLADVVIVGKDKMANIMVVRIERNLRDFFRWGRPDTKGVVLTRNGVFVECKVLSNNTLSTDVELYAGNPVLNSNGLLVGMVSYKVFDKNRYGYVSQGILEKVVNTIIRTKRDYNKSWIGGTFVKFDTYMSAKFTKGWVEPKGYILTDIVEGGPLHKANVSLHSILLSINKKEIDVNELPWLFSPMETVTCVFADETVKVVLDRYPVEKDHPLYASPVPKPNMREVCKDPFSLEPFPLESIRGCILSLVSLKEDRCVSGTAYVVGDDTAITHKQNLEESIEVFVRIGNETIEVDIMGEGTIKLPENHSSTLKWGEPTGNSYIIKRDRDSLQFVML